MKKSIILVYVLVILLYLNSTAQYNYFVGSDAKELNTSMQGFGSISFPSFMWNASRIGGSPRSKIRPFYSANIGFNWKQWRFAENQALLRDDNGRIFVQPNDSENGENYTNSFFSYTKSKLAMGVIRLRPEIGFTLTSKKLSIGTGPLMEFAFAARHKRKFYSNDTKLQKEQNGVDYYNLNWMQLGWGASMGTYYFGVFSYVMITPMFKENLGPNVHAAEIGVYWRILKENYPRFKKKETDVPKALKRKKSYNSFL